MYSLAILGMVEGNGHPYSWSAIFNGYDRQKMAVCPYPVIPEYLGAVPVEKLQIPNARITHIWTDDPEDARRVAQATFIPHILSRPEDAIGQVDAVLITTDIGSEHLSRAMPFLKAGVPIFLDKPLTDCVEDLCIFTQFAQQGAPILSSSCMRYAKEFEPFHRGENLLGPIQYASITTPKSWERYGIHALESIYPILGPGFLSVQNTGDKKRNLIHITHESGADIHAVAIQGLNAGFGAIQLIGAQDCVQGRFRDTYYAFRKQLESFITYLDTQRRPFPFEETEELIKLVIAGKISREKNGRKVFLSELEG